MALGITNKNLTVDRNWAFPVKDATSTGGVKAYQETANINGVTTGTTILTSSNGDFGAAYRDYKAVIYFNSYTAYTATAGGSTVGPMMRLEAATSTAMAPKYVLDQVLLGGTSTDDKPCFYLQGTVPIVAGAQFARVIGIAMSTGSEAASTDFDVIIAAG